MDNGPVVVVTGGASGIGFSVVKKFNNCNFSIAIIDKNCVNKELNELEFNKNNLLLEGDVTDKKEVKELIEKVYNKFGRIDVLVNAAGINYRSSSESFPEDKLNQIINVNLIGTIFMCQEVYPYLKETKGKIINFGSMLAHYGNKNLLAYAASKGGVIQVTKTLAVEWAKDGIRVNSISPGYVETALSAPLQNREFKDSILTKTPLGRLGKKEEMAEVVYFLSTSQSSYINGADIPVDGGLLAGDASLEAPID